MLSGLRHAGRRMRVTAGRGPVALMMLAGIAGITGPIPADAPAATPLPGDYRILQDEPSLHVPGRVLLLEFADFYCPHCHHFDQAVATPLQQEFGDRLVVRLVGFPVIRGPLSTAFEMYEQARAMDRGAAMKDALFHTIHQDKVRVFNKDLRALLTTQLGLDSGAFESGLAGGAPYRAFERGKAWGERIGVTHTPTVVLDGNLKIENLAIDNVRAVINGILERDNAR